MFDRDRIATLSNGDSVPLIPAARALARLQDYLDLPDAEWDVVFHLRELCLDRAIEPEQLRVLVRERLVDEGGQVDPVLQAVVRSAVRGGGRLLHLDSPFVERVDQRIAEFVAARDYLEVELPGEQFGALLRGGGLLDRLHQALGNSPLPPALEDTEGFARRIREQADRKPDGPNP